MKTRAFVGDSNKQVKLRDVEIPEPGPDDLAVRTICSGVSIGTESLWLDENAKDSNAPIATGYQAVGVIESTGANVSDFQPGDRVAYRGPAAMTLVESGKPVTVRNGSHCANAVFPADWAVPVPEGVDPAPASLFVMFGTALHGVDRARPKLEDWVLVHGCGLIGLAVVAVNALHGCRVIAVDQEPGRLEIAGQLGANHSLDASNVDIAEELKGITGGGADVVFESTGVPACVPVAANLCRRGATFVYQGNYGKDTSVEFGFGLAHWYELNMIHTCGPGGNRATETFLKHLARGTVPWDAVITHRHRAEEAEELLDNVLNKRVKDVLGMVIEW